MSQKVALVTGAGSGVGRATTLALLRAGYRVVLAGRRRDALEQTVALTEAGQAGEQALVVPTDVCDPEAIRSLFARTEAAFGRLDVLFNNAGIVQGGPLEELTYEQWQSVVATNLTATFLCTQEAFRLMKRQNPQGGRIINNGSVSAHAPRPDSAPYTATKHAITGLTKSTALEGRKYNIACGQIDIGNALTDNTAGMRQGVPQASGTVEVEPVMDVEHVAQTVLHMADLPLEANILFLTVMATKMPLVGRG
jgi:NAD(P)-dependent dehydrogenase (short-subunit alcohol dehydrogenase family)